MSDNSRSSFANLGALALISELVIAASRTLTDKMSARFEYRLIERRVAVTVSLKL